MLSWRVCRSVCSALACDFFCLRTRSNGSFTRGRGPGLAIGFAARLPCTARQRHNRVSWSEVYRVCEREKRGEEPSCTITTIRGCVWVANPQRFVSTDFYRTYGSVIRLADGTLGRCFPAFRPRSVDTTSAGGTLIHCHTEWSSKNVTQD